MWSRAAKFVEEVLFGSPAQDTEGRTEGRECAESVGLSRKTAGWRRISDVDDHERHLV